MMGKHNKSAFTHQNFKAKARNRVDDLQGMFCDLQQARKENRSVEVALLEEQVNQMLREWKAELHDPSPATSLRVGSPSSSALSSDMERLLQLNEEADDANSLLAACGLKTEPEQHPQHTVQYVSSGVQVEEQEMLERLMRFDASWVGESTLSSCDDESLGMHTHMPLQESFSPNASLNNFCPPHNENSELFLNSSSQSPISPSPSAFLGPKCALWDCPRPAQGEEWYRDYCSSFHAQLALREGASGMAPVLRPGGIDLKDGPLLAALVAKSQGKAVGIPECEGAATSKSPWNAKELFDTSVLTREVIREWLFFDKPRRAFESGTRKQRSLPDYNGRGWHESRKQVMKDMGGLKRSYYMDPQPDAHLEWHLYEYELTQCDACALYRLELKQATPNKKASKARTTQNESSIASLQRQIGRLSANVSSVPESKEGITKGRRSSGSQKGGAAAAVAANGGQPFNAETPDFAIDDVDRYLASP